MASIRLIAQVFSACCPIETFFKQKILTLTPPSLSLAKSGCATGFLVMANAVRLKTC